MRFNAAASPFHLGRSPKWRPRGFSWGDQSERTVRRWEPRDSRPHIDFQERQIAGSERSDRFDGAASRTVGNKYAWTVLRMYVYNETSAKRSTEDAPVHLQPSAASTSGPGSTSWADREERETSGSSSWAKDFSGGSPTGPTALYSIRRKIVTNDIVPAT